MVIYCNELCGSRFTFDEALSDRTKAVPCKLFEMHFLLALTKLDAE